jgi:hypothetical protein
MHSNRPEFIVYAPDFNESVGGHIALHLLCDGLNKHGFRTAIWPMKPSGIKLNEWRSVRCHLGYYLKLHGFRFRRGPFRSPIANRRDIQNAVVIYPEVVSGNPLGAPKVVRWFLHKPGYHTGEINYGKGEIYFFYNAAFNDESINPDTTNHLRLTYINPTYQRTNFGARTKSCYLVRKGRGRTLDKHPPDAILVDNLSHVETAMVFNQAEYLYCYDPYTFYTKYAAICGCVPIIIPEDGVSKEQWQPSPQCRLGLAYGIAEAQIAGQEQDDLLRQLKETTQYEDEMLLSFVRKCRLHFHDLTHATQI